MRPYLTTIILLSLSNVFMTFCMVRTLKESQQQTLDHCGSGELGDCAVRVSASSSCQPNRSNGHVGRPA